MTDAIDAIAGRAADDVRGAATDEEIEDARERTLRAQLRDNRHPLSNDEWQKIQRELVAIRQRREGRAYAATKHGGAAPEAAPSIGLASVGVSTLLAIRSGLLFAPAAPHDPASMTRQELANEIASLKAGIAAFKPPLAPPKAEVKRITLLERELARRPAETAKWPARLDGPSAPASPTPHVVLPGDMKTPVDTLTRDEVVQQIDEMNALARSGVRVPDAVTAAAAKRLAELQRRLAYLDAATPRACDAATATQVAGVGSPPPDLTADRLIELAESKGARFSDAERQVIRTRFEEWKRAQCAATGVDPTSYEIRQDPTRASLGAPIAGTALADRDREQAQRLAMIQSLANNPLAALTLARSWVTNESVEAAWRRMELADAAGSAWAALAATRQKTPHYDTTQPTRVVTMQPNVARPTVPRGAESPPPRPIGAGGGAQSAPPVNGPSPRYLAAQEAARAAFPATQRLPSGRHWTDATFEEFLAEYRARHPKDGTPTKDLRLDYERGKRMDPETGNLRDARGAAVFATKGEVLSTRDVPCTRAVAMREKGRAVTFSEMQDRLVRAERRWQAAKAEVDRLEKIGAPKTIISRASDALGDASKELGEVGSEAYVATKYPGPPPPTLVYPPPGTPSRSNDFDRVYRIADRYGRTTVVVEAKGGRGKLGFRKVDAAGGEAQQGTRRYLEETIRVMQDRGDDAAKDAAAQLANAQGRIVYIEARATGGAPSKIEGREFDMSVDTGVRPKEPRQ